MKVDARVPGPEVLDLTQYLAHGVQSGEVEMPAAVAESSTSASAPTAVVAAPEPDEDVIAQLMSMGFAENGCRKAAMTTSDVEVAMNWILMHMDDPDFNDPPVSTATGGAGSASGTELSPAVLEAIGLITSMGYTESQAHAALKATDNNIERSLLFAILFCLKD